MVVVVDYKAGNLYNVGNALKYLGVAHEFSYDPQVIRNARKVILPGVGSARAAMDSLRERNLVEVLRGIDVPFLGICLGLQLLFERSDEDDTECLGIIPGTVKRFDSGTVKVPHIGWNRVEWMRSENSPLFTQLCDTLPSGEFFYFVHSYYAPLEPGVTAARTEYGVTFSSAVSRENFIGLQFHPERSGQVGLDLLERFLKL